MEILNVIKIGGSIIEDPKKLDALLESFSALNQKKILVHGGGSLASKFGSRLGIIEQKVEGRRITDDETLEVVTMVYAGLINKKIVAKLQSYGCQALGLTGADGDYFRSSKRPPINGLDFGWVGDPVYVRTTFLQKQLEDSMVPVAAPLTHDGEGQLLNTNADTIAATIASAMTKHYEVNLIYAFEINGVYSDLEDAESLVKKLTKKKYVAMKSTGSIINGMIPKLDNAFNAISKGVSSVKLVKFDCIGRLDNVDFNEFTNIEK